MSLASAHSRGEWPGRACSSSVVLAEIHHLEVRCVPRVLAAHIQPFSQCAHNSAESGHSQPSFFDLAVEDGTALAGLTRSVAGGPLSRGCSEID